MADSRFRQFRHLVEPQLGRLYRMAVRLAGNRADAEDLVQDTCLRAWTRFPDGMSPEHAERWLFSVLYHRFVDDERRQRRSPVRPLNGAEDPAAQLPTGLAGPEELAQQAESEREFDVAWSKLDAGQRVLLTLRAEGHGLGDIEAITGIGREVLRARLHRARRSLARLLRDSATSIGDKPGNRRRI